MSILFLYQCPLKHFLVYFLILLLSKHKTWNMEGSGRGPTYVLSLQLPGGTDENNEKLYQYNRCIDRD
jgi:hypothetical protein